MSRYTYGENAIYMFFICLKTWKHFHMSLNIWNTYGKHTENMWKTYGKHVTNISLRTFNMSDTYYNFICRRSTFEAICKVTISLLYVNNSKPRYKGVINIFVFYHYYFLFVYIFNKHINTPKSFPGGCKQKPNVLHILYKDNCGFGPFPMVTRFFWNCSSRQIWSLRVSMHI